MIGKNQPPGAESDRTTGRQSPSLVRAFAALLCGGRDGFFVPRWAGVCIITLSLLLVVEALYFVTWKVICNGTALALGAGVALEVLCGCGVLAGVDIVRGKWTRS